MRRTSFKLRGLWYQTYPKQCNISRVYPIKCCINKLKFTSNSNNNSDTNNITNTNPIIPAHTKDTSDIQNDNDTNDTIDDIKKDNNISSDKIDKRAYLLALSSFFMGTGIGVILPVMPNFAQSMGLSTSQYGAVIGVMGVTRLLFNIPAAYLADKYGRRPLLVSGPIITSIGMTCTAIVTSFNQLLGTRFLTGMGGSLQMAGAQSYLSDISTTKTRARTMAPLMIGFSGGAAMGPAIGGYLCDNYGLQLPFVFVGGAILCVATNNYFSLPETKIIRRNTIDKDTSMKSQIYQSIKSYNPVFKEKDNINGILVHTLFWFAQSGATFTLMPLFATKELALTSTEIGSLFVMMSVVNVFGVQIFSWISDKYGRKKTIVPATILCSCVLPLIPFSSNLNELGILLFAWSVGSTMISTSPVSYISDINNDNQRTTALAVLRMGGDVGLMLGSASLGLICQQFSYNVAFNAASFTLIASGLNFAFRATESVQSFHKINKTK